MKFLQKNFVLISPFNVCFVFFNLFSTFLRTIASRFVIQDEVFPSWKYYFRWLTDSIFYDRIYSFLPPSLVSFLAWLFFPSLAFSFRTYLLTYLLNYFLPFFSSLSFFHLLFYFFFSLLLSILRNFRIYCFSGKE